jgi:hypothetical protein
MTLQPIDMQPPRPVAEPSTESFIEVLRAEPGQWFVHSTGHHGDPDRLCAYLAPLMRHGGEWTYRYEQADNTYTIAARWPVGHPDHRYACSVPEA